MRKWPQSLDQRVNKLSDLPLLRKKEHFALYLLNQFTNKLNLPTSIEYVIPVFEQWVDLLWYVLYNPTPCMRAVSGKKKQHVSYKNTLVHSGEWWFVSRTWAATGHQLSLAWVRSDWHRGRKDVGSVFNRMSVLMMRPGSSHWGLGVSQCLFLFTPQLSWRPNRTSFLFKLLLQVSMHSEVGLGDCLAKLLLVTQFLSLQQLVMLVYL